MAYLFPENLSDSISIFLRKDDFIHKTDSISWDFDQFEYLPTSNNGLLFNGPLDNSYSVVSNGFDGLSLIFPLQLGSIFFIVFLFCFAIFSFVFSRERTSLTGNFNTIISFRSRSATAYKEQVTTAEVWGEFFMIFQAILLFSIILYTYLFERDFSFLTLRSFTLYFLVIFIILSLLASLKYIIYRSISFFFLHVDIKNWINKYFRLLEILGLILFFPTILYVYLPEIRDAIQILIIIIFISSRLIVLIELLNIFVKNKVGGFYFFAYLCGTEIAPYLIYYKGVVLLISISGNIII